jgi:hypothetical protein
MATMATITDTTASTWKTRTRLSAESTFSSAVASTISPTSLRKP